MGFDFRSVFRLSVFKSVKVESSVVPLESLRIEIKDKNFQKLVFNRKMLLAKGFIGSGTDNGYVPAKIYYKDKTYKVKLRFKGDWLDHISDPSKWSYRIKVKGDDPILGMFEFAIQTPDTRGGIGEWFVNKIFKREGIVAPRYQFVEVVQNGRYQGIYAVEERFNKRMIENNKFREGPIVRFNDHLYFENNQRLKASGSGLVPSDLLSYSSNIDGHDLKNVLSDPKLKSDFLRAVSLLEGFRNKDLKPSQVFDIEKLAKFYAITDITGANHASYYGNIKYYYNPVTGFLEPIGYDAMGLQNIIYAFVEELALVNDLKYSGRREEHRLNWILRDKEFFRVYVKTLIKFSQTQFADDILGELSSQLEGQKKAFAKTKQDQTFPKSFLYSNQRYIRGLLNPKQGLHAYLAGYKKDTLILKVGNLQRLPFEILYVSFDGKKLLPAQEDWMWPKLVNEPMEFKLLKFIYSQGDIDDKMISSGKLKIHYRIPGQDNEIVSAIYPWDNYQRDRALNHVALKTPNVEQFKFVMLDLAKRLIVFKPGRWTLDRDMIIPKGFIVMISKGTMLNLINSAMIFSPSILQFNGTEESPIIIDSSDSTGQGLFVANTQKDVSNLEYVIFRNLKNPSRSSWSLSGAVNFYQAPVNIQFCKFIGNRADDSLSIVRSDFDIKESVFNGANSDALDIDFSMGTIEGMVFTNSGNDALDISGTTLTAKNLLIMKAGDKGISLGEDSTATIESALIQNSKIGLAVKDLSKLRISGIKISNCEIGITAFQKKAEYGPGYINIMGVNMDSVKVPYVLEYRSSILVDGKAINPTHQNVRKMFYGSAN